MKLNKFFDWCDFALAAARDDFTRIYQVDTNLDLETCDQN